MMKWELKECGWKVEGKARHKGGSVGNACDAWQCCLLVHVCVEWCPLIMDGLGLLRGEKWE